VEASVEGIELARLDTEQLRHGGYAILSYTDTSVSPWYV
jgi:hypothetical protein